MNISEYSVKHPVTVIMIFALVIGMAVTMIPTLAVDLFPSVQNPVLSVFVSFPGAGPTDIEKNVTERLERALASSRNLVNMTSSSQFESCFVNLQFTYGQGGD